MVTNLGPDDVAGSVMLTLAHETGFTHIDYYTSPNGQSAVITSVLMCSQTGCLRVFTSGLPIFTT